MTNYQPVIGLEVHIELKTASKMFCSCSADYFTTEPNTHVCPVCLGLPGAMPVANKKAIELAQLFGLALDCKLNSFSKFDRKNYFYPDLAKGFQISQYDLPFSEKGSIFIATSSSLTSEVESGRQREKTSEVFQAIGTKKIGITRAHLEEDTGKLAHTKINGRDVTLIDFNRSGVPLLEIVTEPDMTSSAQAKVYAQKLQQIARYIGASDADMEEGSMRIEPNVSLRKTGQNGLPNYKVELKNINSFRFAQKAIEFEIKRQTEILESGKTPAQETRGWNETKNQTVSQRSKEEAHDYRYFPEPDLPPLTFSNQYLHELKGKLPELPDKKFERFKEKYKLTDYEAEILTRNIQIAAFFEEAEKAAKETQISAKKVALEIINKKPDIENTLPAEFIVQIKKSATTVQVDDKQLKIVIEQVLSENPKAVEDYKQGKENAIMFLLGQVMRKDGKID